ncbi:MAG: flagellar basal body rod protein FlgG [Solibacillus sp.]
MLRSMYSGVSGLKNFQTKLDVIGNNIANVNTYGFKKERTVFKDLISQTTAGASGPSQIRGGVNSIQIGLGAQLAAIDTIHNGGTLQTTARTLDLGISGEGFFMVADSLEFEEGDADAASVATGFDKMQYTRAGNFYMDRNGYLVNGDGKYLVGFANENVAEYDAIDDPEGWVSNFDEEMDATVGDIEAGTNIFEEGALPDGAQPIRIPVTAQEMNISANGTISFVDSTGKLQYAGTIVVSKFPNASGLTKQGGNYFAPTQNSGEPYAQFATFDGIGTINSGYLEMSNVDLSEEFTEMIVAQRGFQANSRIITTSDEILQELVNLKR